MHSLEQLNKKLPQHKLAKRIEKLSYKLDVMDCGMENEIYDLMDKYLQGPNYTKSFYHEYVWTHFTRIEFSIKQLMLQNGEENYFRFETLLHKLEKFNNKWVTCKKDKNGEFIDGSSKFATLVKTMMRKFKFNHRLKIAVGV